MIFLDKLVKISLFLALVLAACSTATFHSKYGSWSPSRRYRVDLVQRDFGQTLLLRDHKTEDLVFSMQIQRNFECVWDPKERAIAILDNFASNENRLLIMDLQSGHTLLTATRESVSGATAGMSIKYGHVYFEKPKWRADFALSCYIEMYDPISEASAPSFKTNLRFALNK
jgi:hypothetical protein